MRALRRKLKVRLPIFDQFGGGCTEKGIRKKIRQGVEKMNSMKLFAIAVAVMMLAVAGIAVMSASEDSDATATTTSGTYSVYVNDGTGWQSSVVNTNVYDAAQAVKQSGFWQNDDVMVEKYIPGTWVTYNGTTYGDISTFMGKSNIEDGDQWNVFVGVKNGQYLDISAAAVSIGNYTCFDDYSYVTANVVLYYGSSSIALSTVQASLDTYYATSGAQEASVPTVVEHGDDGFKFTFALHMDLQYNPANNNAPINATVVGTYYGTTTYNGSTPIQVTNSNLKSSVIYLTGYGSNAYLALKEVIDDEDDLDAETSVQYYSWINTFLGLGTIQTEGLDTPLDWYDDDYAYWIVMDLHSYFNDQTNHVGDFVLGAYAPFSFAPIYDQTIALVFGTYSMTA
jgi:hypothetical protein